MSASGKSGHCKVADECPLSGVKRTSRRSVGHVAYDPKRTFAHRPLPSQAGVRAVSISPTPERFEYVLALLASIRTAYFWTLSGYCWHARSTIRNEVLCGRFTRRLKLKSMNNPNPKTKTKTMKAASRTKVVSGVANNSGVDRTSPVKGGPKARRANKPGQQGGQQR